VGADGALIEDVLSALRNHGVTVTEVAKGEYELNFQGVLEVHTLHQTVSRRMLQYFVRKFNGPSMASFFPPPGGMIH
jgi:hypothetical protein